MKILRFFPILIVASLCALSSLWSQETPPSDRYRSKATGNWEDPSTWEVSTDGGSTWNPASTAPSSSNALHTLIRSGHTVTVRLDVANDETVIEVSGQVTVNSGKVLTAQKDLTVSGTIAGVDASSMIRFVGSSGNTLTLNNAVISIAKVNFDDPETHYIKGTGTFTGSTLTIDGGSDVKLSGDLTVTGGTILINTERIELQGYTLTLDGTILNLGSSGYVEDFGESGKVVMKGTASIIQGGTFLTPIEINSGTSTVNCESYSNSFDGEITVLNGATLSIPSGKSIYADDNITINTVGTINGSGTLSFDGSNKTLSNNGTITAPTAITYTYGITSITGNGIWKSLTIAASCSTTVAGQHSFTGAGTAFVVNGTVTLNSGSTIIYSGSSSQTVMPLPYENLGINNSAGATLSSAGSVAGVLTLTAGSFNVGSNLTLGSSASTTRQTGSLSGTPTFGSQVNVSYIGTTGVTTGTEIPSNPATLINLTINNSGGVTMGGAATVNGALSVTGGNLSTGSNTVTLGSVGTIAESGSYSVIGKLAATRILSAGNDTFGGMGTEINAGGSPPGVTTVTRTTGTASTISSATAIKRYVDISPSFNSGLNATFVFHYNTGELNGTNESNLRLFKSTDGGTTWTNVGGTVDAFGNTITLTGVNSLSRWTAGEVLAAPTLSSISPSFAVMGSTLDVTLTGTSFVNGGSTVSFSGTGITVNSVTFNSSTQISANITIASGAVTGARDVSVTTSAGTATLTNGFEVRNPAPALTSITPPNGTRGQTLTVTLQGSGFVSGATTVSFGDSIAVSSVVVGSSTSLTAQIAVAQGATLGARNVAITNPSPGGGTATLSGGFTVNNPVPSLVSLAPISGSRGQTLDVVLTGSAFVRDTSKVSFGDGITIVSTTFNSSTSLTARLTIASTSATGTRDVTVTNTAPGGGTSTLSAYFSVVNPVPTITSVSPDSGARGQSVDVAVTGTGFISGVTSADFGADIGVSLLNIVSSTQLTARLTIQSTAASGPRNVLVTNVAPGGGTASLTNGFRVANLPPTITSITPPSAVSGQTLTLTITGTNFVSGQTAVTFGAGITVNSVTVSSPTGLSVAVSISPTTSGGTRDVTVTNPPPGGGSATLLGGFVVSNPSPTMTSLSATSGERGKAGGLLVTGSGFVPGATTMSFGSGITVTSLTVSNANQMFVNISIARDAALGPRDVSVTNAAPGGGTASLPAYFAVVNPFPSLTGVTPNTGLLGQTLSVTLAGSDFFDGISTVGFGAGITVNSATSNTAGTQITAGITIASSASPGARNVTVTNPGPGGGTVTLASGFSVASPAPTFAALSPATGARGQILTAALTGSNFISGTTTVSFGTGITVTTTTASSSTQMSAVINIGTDAALGPRDVVVTNAPPGGGSATLLGAFSVVNPSPTLTGVSPAVISKGDVLDVTLTGTNFISGVTTVAFGDSITVNSLTVNSLTQATANVAVRFGAAPGPRAVTVTNAAPGGGSSTLANALTIGNPAPTLTSVSPKSGTKGQTLNVNIKGTGFSAGVTTVNFGAGVAVNSLAVTSSTQMTANITIDFDAPAGPRSVSVTNAAPGGGDVTLTDAFGVENPAPTASTVSPANGARGGALSVTITGSNFISGVTNVSFGVGITVGLITVSSSTQVTANITVAADAVLGPRDVVVTNTAPGGGSVTLAGAFTVNNPIPTIASITPAIGTKGQTLAVTIVGTGFIAGVTTPGFGPDVTVNSTTVGGLTQLTANITIALTAATGPRNVVVTNAAPGGGTATLTSAFTVGNPVPTLASISPISGSRGQTLSITFTGTNFLAGVTTASFGPGITVNSFTVNSSTQATANISIALGAATGSRDVSVTNAAPGGGTATSSGAFTVTNPAPTISSVTPTSAGRGSFINVTIIGAQFTSGVTSVDFGTDITVTSLVVKSSTELLANIAIAASAASGPRNVTVTNAGPGGGSASVTGGVTVTSGPATGVEGELGVVPDEYVLQEAYPNPFNPSTRIRYGLPEDSRIRLDVHNMLGNVVAELVSGERSKGSYELQWYADNLPSGVYLVRIHAESLESTKRFIASRKVVLVK